MNLKDPIFGRLRHLQPPIDTPLLPPSAQEAMQSAAVSLRSVGVGRVDQRKQQTPRRRPSVVRAAWSPFQPGQQQQPDEDAAKWRSLFSGNFMPPSNNPATAYDCRCDRRVAPANNPTGTAGGSAAVAAYWGFGGGLCQGRRRTSVAAASPGAAWQGRRCKPAAFR